MPLQSPGLVPEHCGPSPEGPGPPTVLEPPALRVARRCSPVGFGRQHILARPVGHSTTTASTSATEMADAPITYEELTEDHKKKYNEVKALFEADLIGSFERTRSHGIRWKGFSPEGVLDEVDLSLPSEERTRALRQEVNYMVAHSIHRHSESLVNSRIALRVVQEIMKHQYSPSGPALGTHHGEIPFQTRPQLPFTLAAPEPQASPAYIVYKFGILPKRRTIGYSKPYPNEYDLIPLPPKYRLPEFSKFNGSEGSSSIEHVSRYLAQLGIISASDPLRVRFFAQSLTGPAFGWYTSLPPDSVRTWKQLEEQFHVQYHSSYEAGIAAQCGRCGEKRCRSTFSVWMSRTDVIRSKRERSADLAVVGLAAPFKDLTFQVDYNSLAHLVQKLTLYEQCHPELFQDKFKRPIGLIETEDVEDSEDQEVAVAEWARGAAPVSCKWVKQQGPAKGFDFDISKAEQIFDLLLKEKQLKLPEGHKIPTAQEMNGRPYCKWHHSFTHITNDCKELRRQIQTAIEQGRLILGQFVMKVDTHPFPWRQHGGTQSLHEASPGFSFEVNMAGPVHHHGNDKEEIGHSRGKEKEEAGPRDRPRYDDRRYVTEEQVRSVRYQRPLSAHLLNKYEHQYDRRRRYDIDDERYRRSDADNRKYRRYDRDDEGYERRAKGKSREQEDLDRHWDCPFFKHCWDSGMSRLPTIDNCPECRQQKKDTGDVSVFKRLGPLPSQNRQAESSQGKISRVRG
ncbi:hypothetical protein QYE76_051166 [Lolium multiflorum]|uniref:Uncharacterized protein n=1 Tax=Lolium multiflorum TaxID=4521 RepID=A0AAD8WHN1_LOLMU|nr:hypothetical protein QYE76_051166 [Lolium multiflorum]